MTKTCTLNFNGRPRTCYIYHSGSQHTRLEDVINEQETQCLRYHSFIAVDQNGGVLDWSSRLEEGEVIDIRPMHQDDLKMFQVTINKQGDHFSFEDAMKIRAYEQEHGSVWEMNLEEIKLILSK